jgi:uncharacterized protein YjbJ (UPF0337 family)
MGMDDKIENKAQGLEAIVKEKVGEVRGDEQWPAVGKAEQAKSGVKQVAEKIKDTLAGNDEDS